MIDLVNKNNECDTIIEKVNKSDISSIRVVLAQLMEIIHDPEWRAVELIRIIERDPTLTAKLIKVANSAYYGFTRNICTIHDAIVLVGFNTVKELSLNLTVCKLFNNTNCINDYSRTALWKHCLSVAILNKFFYMREFRKPGEEAYIAGLLHDIGIIIEDQFMQERFKCILEHSKKNECNLPVSESNIIGFDHAEIGMKLAESWNFPDELVVAIGNHHDPFKGNATHKKISLMSFVSDYICQRNDIGYCDAPYENQKAYKKCLMEMNIQESAVNLMVDDMIEEVQKIEKAGWFNYE